MQSVASTHVQESRVIAARQERVWELIRPLTFSWLSSVKEVKVEQGSSAAEVGSQRRVVYKDGTVQTLKVLELSDINMFVTYELIASEPAISVSSAVHTIRLFPVTFDNTCLVQWTSDFSNDATQAVVQDSKYKKQEAFADIVKAVAKSAPQGVKRASSPVKEQPQSPKKVAK